MIGLRRFKNNISDAKKNEGDTQSIHVFFVSVGQYRQETSLDRKRVDQKGFTGTWNKKCDPRKFLEHSKILLSYQAWTDQTNR